MRRVLREHLLFLLLISLGGDGGDGGSSLFSCYVLAALNQHTLVEEDRGRESLTQTFPDTCRLIPESAFKRLMFVDVPVGGGGARSDRHMV